MHFENSDYVVDAEKKSGCLLEVKVEVKPPKVAATYKKALKTINKEISLPGFRKGKVPDEVVLAKYAPQVEKEWKELLLNEGFVATMDLTQIFPLNKKSVQKASVEKCALNEGAMLNIHYEYYPSLPRIEFSNLNLPDFPVPAPTEEEINALLREIQESHAEWIAITDRPSQYGDHVTVSLKNTENNKPLLENHRCKIDTNTLVPWLANLLVGRKTGEVAEGETAPDTNASAEAKANHKPLKVELTLHSIEEARLPPVDDQLALKAGATNAEDLLSKIRAKLLKEKEEAQKEKKYASLREALLKKYDFDLPASLQRSEVEERKNLALEKLKAENLSEEELSKKKSQLETDIENQALRGLRNYFITKQLAEQGAVSVSREELNEELQMLFYLYQKEKITEEFVTRIRDRIFQRKVMEYALSQLEKP